MYHNSIMPRFGLYWVYINIYMYLDAATVPSPARMIPTQYQSLDQKIKTKISGRGWAVHLT